MLVDQKKLSGGGAVLDHTVHVIDVWRWMLEEEVVKVYAESGQLFYPDINIDESGLLSVEFQGGAFGTLDTSWSRPNNSFPTWGDVTMEIVGEKGSIPAISAVDVYMIPCGHNGLRQMTSIWKCRRHS